MLKRMICIAPVLVAVAMTGTASARTNWQGAAMFTAVTNPACGADGWGVGSSFLSTFLPRTIDDNGLDSFIAFFQQRQAYAYKVPNGSIAAGKNYSGIEITSASSFFPFAGKIVDFRTVPAVIAINTPFITMTGKISNWAGTVGCTVTFNGAYVLRP